MNVVIPFLEFRLMESAEALYMFSASSSLFLKTVRCSEFFNFFSSLLDRFCNSAICASALKVKTQSIKTGIFFHIKTLLLLKLYDRYYT